MPELKISFILPIYNVDLYLANAIESILKQEISKEIILVDDGSTDESLNIALMYAKQYSFIYVIHSKNKGVSTARNTGLRLAKGEYIVFIDPDDTLADGLDLKLVYQVLIDNHCPIGKGLFDITFQDKRNFLFSPINKEVMDNNIVITPKSTNFALHSLPSNWFIHIGSYIIKRELLEQYNIQFKEFLQITEDIIFSLDLLSIDETIIEFPFLFYNYHKRADSLTDQPISKEILAQKAIALNYLKEYRCKNEKLTLYANKLYEIHLEDYRRGLKDIKE